MILEWGAFNGKEGNLLNQLLKHEARRRHQVRGPHEVRDWATEDLATAECS